MRLNFKFLKATKNLVNTSQLARHGFLTAPFKELEKFPKSINSYESLHRFSIEEPDKFWGILARSRLDWFQDFGQVSSGTFKDEDFNLKWFVDGKLNVSVNCVDRHFNKNPNGVALIWDKNEAGKFLYSFLHLSWKNSN